MGLQDWIVAMVVLGAAAWLTRRWWRRRKRVACTCDGCPVAEQAEAAANAASQAAPPSGGTLITIEGPSARH